MNYSAAENGGRMSVSVWAGVTAPAWLSIHCGPSKAFLPAAPYLMAIFNGFNEETVLAGRYLISGSFESQRPDWVSSAQINWQ